MTLIVDEGLDLGAVWVGSSGYYMHGMDKLVHRTVAELALGRKLKKLEYVHHVDYNKHNNLRSNLVICDAKFHMWLHKRTDCINAGFDPNTHLKCTRCKTYHHRDLFAKWKGSSTGHALSCRESLNTWRKDNGHTKTPWTAERKLQQQVRRALQKRQ